MKKVMKKMGAKQPTKGSKTKLAPVNAKKVVQNKSPLKKAKMVPKGRRTMMEDTPV